MKRARARERERASVHATLFIVFPGVEAGNSGSGGAGTTEKVGGGNHQMAPAAASVLTGGGAGCNDDGARILPSVVVGRAHRVTRGITAAARGTDW